MLISRAGRRPLTIVLAVVLVATQLAAWPRSVDAHDGVRLRTTAPIVVTAPKKVTVGGRIAFVGDVVVKRKKPRPVAVAERSGGRWRVVGRATSKANGTFTVRVAAGTATGSRVFRAQAAAAHGLAAVRTGAVRVTVTKKPVSTGTEIPGTDEYDAAEALPASYDAVGPKGDWSYLFVDQHGDEQSVRWDPCPVIRWRYNAAGQEYAARADVTRAIAKISGVTGLKFKYVGSTGFRYVGQADPDFPHNADLFVSWASEKQYGQLAGGVVGTGGGLATSAGAGALDVDWRMDVGYLTLDSGAPQIARGFDGSGWGQIMMHEVLHALGLGHAQTSQQLMAPVADDDNYQFGAGDITGMHRIGLRSTDSC
ncbi:matrixin family metalloprotease [Nocardioides conyzicola]|uniref:Peptidase metallopeptidase domain-containing protein n=1 Tax=Nocardioides conyzicola TaxID=1651781 RepID=A0ABP8Y2Z9_9ACTN